MSSARDSSGWKSTGLAILLASAVMLPVLGHRTLTAWDEAIYAEVAREMLGHNWLVPHWNGQLWFEKPPLMMWTTAVFFKLFGIHEFWARAGSALSGIAAVGLLHGWLKRRRDTLTAWLSTVILLSTFGFLHAGSTGELDLMLSLGCVVAIVGLAEIDNDKAWGWCLYWGGFALAVMTKGAAAVVLPMMLPFALGLRPGGLKQRWFWLGLMLFGAAVLPWHLLMFYRFGAAFAHEYLGFHVVARATGQIEGHLTPWWFYAKVMLADAAPWVLLYPFAIAAAFRRPGRRMFAIFAVMHLGFFTLVQTRLAQYVVPLYPVLALLTATFLADGVRRAGVAARPLRFRMALAIGAAALCVVSALLTMPARRHLHEARLANGTVVPRDRESVALLIAVMPREKTMRGPLLLWRKDDGQSIAPTVFYAGRSVQQVQLRPVATKMVVRYTYDPKPLYQMVDTFPGLILLDRSLVSAIPREYIYRRIEAGPTLEIGSLQHPLPEQ